MSGEKVVINKAAVAEAAKRYQQSAEAIAEAVKALQGMQFGGASAGRKYVREGSLVQEGMHALVERVRQWGLSSVEISVALQESNALYAQADDSHAQNLQSIVRLDGWD
ncbi:MAG: type VII secretion target [Mycobacteriaceae bacterium]